MSEPSPSSTRSELGAEQNRAAERAEQQRRLRDALTWSTRQGGNLAQVRAVLSPAARDFLDAMGDKIDRDMVRLTEAERTQVKLHGARGAGLDELARHFAEADIAALEATRAPEASKAFDHELQQ